MSVGYLSDSFLAELADGDLGSDVPTVSSAPLPGEPGYVELITLPGGVTMPKQTFYLIIGVILAVAIYFYRKNQKTEPKDEE